MILIFFCFRCCVCFDSFGAENPRVKPFLCDHSVDHKCFKSMEIKHPAGSKCPQCRAIKKMFFAKQPTSTGSEAALRILPSPTPAAAGAPSNDDISDTQVFPISP